MQQTPKLRDLIQHQLDKVFASHIENLTELGPEASVLLREAERFLTGGKRLRARLLLLGFEAVSEQVSPSITDSTEATAAVKAATALELFHAAALIHDDIIDDSAVRRGQPASHEFFAEHHRSENLRGDHGRFGRSAAILLGDLLQSWADELFQSAMDDLINRDHARAARTHFNRMRSEVALGQYLDVLEEQQPSFADDQEQLERSTRVLIYKSAKYSVEAPLLIGAAMAGATSSQQESLSEFGLPVGVAFQLRDDVLGVFGDEQLTGKPTGDDLTEGKRTVLVALAREQLPSGPRRVFDEMHGEDGLEPGQIEMLQQTIRDTGALARVEQMITKNIGIAREVLGDSDLHVTARKRLIELAEFIGSRTS